MTLHIQVVVGRVTLSQVVPLSVDLTMFPEPPTATKTPEPDDEEEEEEEVGAVVSTVKGVIVRVLLAFPAESVTVIVQSEYVPSFKETKVMVLFPEGADVVLEVQDPPYVMVPA